MAKTFSVSFNINGAMDGSLASALQNASRLMRGLGESARATSAAAKASQAGLRGLANSLGSIQQAAQQFKTLQDAVKQTAADFQRSTAAIDAAKAKYQQDAQAVEQLRQKLAQLSTELAKAKNKKLVQSDGVRAATADLQALKRAYEAAKAAGDQMRMSSLSRQIEQTQQALERQRRTAREAAQSYKELSDKLKQTKAELKAAETAANQSGKGLSRMRTDAQNLSQSFQQQLAALNRLKASLSAAGFDTSNFAASEERLRSEINRVNAALERQAALQNAQRASSQASQEMFNAYNNFQGALQTASSIAAPFKSAADTAIEFEHAMSRVKALTQSQNIREGRTAQVESEMKLLTQQARDLGAATMFTSTQAAQAMGYLGMAGWKTQQIYGTMPGMLDLAAAAGADLAQTADIVSDNMTAMGVPVNQAAHFMDVYAYALTNSNARLSDFGETMKYAAPVAKAYGSTLDETAAMVMMMANAGIKGSMAGTSLRMGLLRLAGPPKTATKEMEKLGLSLSDAQAGALEAEAVIKGLGIDLTGATSAGDKMTRVLMQLHEKTKDLSQDAKLAAFKGIFGVNAETGWLALFDQGPEVFMKYLAGLRAADGYAAQVAETMNDDTRGALIRLESAWDAFKERVGEGLTPAIKTVADTFTPLVSSMAQWVEAHPAVVQAAAAIAGALAGIVVAAAAVKLACTGWTFITSTIGLVQAGLASLGSGALLGGLIGRLAALRTMLFGLGGAATLGGWSAMFGAIANKATLAMRAIRGFFASLTLGGMASGVVGVLQSIGTAILGAARAAMMFALSPVGVALMALALAGLYCYQNWDKVAPVLSNIANIITGSLSSAIATIQPAIAGLIAAFENLAGNGALSQLGMIFTGVLATVVTALAGVLATVINVGASIIAAVTNVITGIVNLVSNVLSGNWSAAWESMKSIATSVIEGIGNVAKSIFGGIVSTIENIGKAWDYLRGVEVPSPTVEAPAQPQVPAQVSAPTIAAPAMPEVAPIDTSATQAALDSVGDAAANAAANMDGVNQAVQNISQVGSEFQTVSTNAQTAGTNVQTLGQNSQLAGEAMLQIPPHAEGLNTALDLPIGNLGALGDAAGNSVGNIDAMSTAAGAVASALSAKAAEIGSIHISIPTVSVGGAVAANAEGGIYRRGAFLTTFAEESPEAAIPLDNSQRARDLWTQAGQMLGMFPQTQSPQFDVKLPTPTFPQIDLPQGEEISARQSKRRRPQGTMPPIKMPRRETPKFLDVLGRALGGGLVGKNQSAIEIPKIEIPTPTFPTIESPQEDGGLIGGLRRDAANLSTQEISAAPTINVTVNVTVNGNADESTVRRGVESATPALTSSLMDAWFNARERERRRRSFA